MFGPPQDDDSFAAARRRMVDEQLGRRDITDQRVLDVMGRVPRERFVSPNLRPQAYQDHPLPIGLGQTISQPYIVALMTQLARPTPESRALDIGVGSGYQAAILAELCQRVYGIEILEPLANDARELLAALGYRNVDIRCGDAYDGWPDRAPFDVIISGAAPARVPRPLVEQLAPGGRLVIPVGRHSQELLFIEKQPDGTLLHAAIAPVQFVPMTGAAEGPQPDER
jgi:protein-L-isoaspartate(D-aspartate) O-methyltransferase